MPSFNAPQSPSLRKNEAFGNRSIMRPKQRFSVGRIIGDPFALATISISILAWLIAFVSNIISDIDTNFPNFVWWAVVYFLCCIIGVILAVGGDAAYTYHVAIVGFLSAGLVLTTSAVNSMVYSSNGAEEAAAAGFILLSMVAILWIFYFGSQPSAAPRVFIDSFALHKGERPSPRSSRQMSSHHYGNNANSFTHPANNTYANNHLNGFEATSPGPGLNGANGVDRASQPRFGTATEPDGRLTTIGGIGDAEAGAEAVTEYPFKAKAIYPYEANPDDPNEISFAKHEILEVSDVSGRWWQARKATREIGIAPSNYLILL